MLTVDGLATGLDTGQVIEGLLAVQQAQIDRINGRKQDLVQQQTAFRTAEARLLELQSSISGLRRVGDNVFQRKQAVVSDEAVEVSVSNVATPGTYNLRVDALAQAHQIVSDGFASGDAQIAKGEFSFQVGSATPVKVVIGDSNNTLDGLVDAINTARNDVTATTIIQAGTHRLLLTSNTPGAAHEIGLNFDLADPQDTTPFPTFDLDNPVQAASDATIVIGNGAGALTLTSETNQVDNLLPGVTMNLLRSDSTKTISLTIGRDVEPAREAISGFVETYNDVLGFLEEQQQFDPETGTASLLFANRDLTSIRDSLSRIITSSVAGAGKEMNRLSALGIRPDARGRLTIRSSELDDVLNERVDNVSLEDVEKLFRVHGESDTPQIRFVIASDKTVASVEVVNGVATLDPYQVEVLQAAEKARVVGAYPLSASVTIDGANDQLTVSVDGQASELLTLTQGDYSPQELADHLQDLINDDATLAGRDVSVSIQNGFVEISSATYGKSSEIEMVAGTALSVIGFAVGDADEGQDVIGRYIVEDDQGDPIRESAVGRGQILMGDEPDGATNGLEVRVTLDQSQVGQSVTADVTVTRGIAAELNRTLDGLLNVGKLRDINNTFSDRIESIDQSIDRLNTRFESQRESLIQQFARLETTVSELQAAGSFLSSQLAGLPQIGL